MNILSSVITYIRRIIKTQTNADISDNLLIDYINRFVINELDARIQLFDYKTKYSFLTTPGVDRYNMPLYNLQIEPGNQTIGYYPVYQGVMGPAYVNGVPVSFHTEKNTFFPNLSNVVQNMQVVDVGDGSVGPYTINLPIGLNNYTPVNPPVNSILRGHVDISGIISTGNNNDPVIGLDLDMDIPITSIDSAVYFTSTDATGKNIIISDSGQFLTGNVNFGLLMNRVPANGGLAPFGYSALVDSTDPLVPYSTTINTINYQTGTATIQFPTAIPVGVNINAQAYFYQSGLPISILAYNNVLTLRSPPSQQFLVELDAYLTPAAYLSTADYIKFGYMSDYIAYGAARKILSDTGDIEQFQFYEILFREQERLVQVRAERQWTATRTQTMYSQGLTQTFGSTVNGGLY